MNITGVKKAIAHAQLNCLARTQWKLGILASPSTIKVVCGWENGGRQAEEAAMGLETRITGSWIHEGLIHFAFAKQNLMNNSLFDLRIQRP